MVRPVLQVTTTEKARSFIVEKMRKRFKWKVSNTGTGTGTDILTNISNDGDEDLLANTTHLLLFSHFSSFISSATFLNNHEDGRRVGQNDPFGNDNYLFRDNHPESRHNISSSIFRFSGWSARQSLVLFVRVGDTNRPQQKGKDASIDTFFVKVIRRHDDQTIYEEILVRLQWNQGQGDLPPKAFPNLLLLLFCRIDLRTTRISHQPGERRRHTDFESPKDLGSFRIPFRLLCFRS